ncbi:TPA: RNA ligase partner protein [Candidatus Woesearchaeota archaeon]|nr:RNA ligase partner protein [Candidatus Woesearchaeota archaeon]
MVMRKIRAMFRGTGFWNYVLDTSLFVNPDARKYFGQTVDDAVANFLAAAAKMKNVRFYMPPSVKKELRYFAQKELPNFRRTILVKSPPMHEMKVPATIMWKLLDEIRARVNAGLRVSEKFVKDEKMPIDEKLHRLRIQYKEALREGVLDSEEDFEVLMLAKDLKAAIVSLDQGLIRAAEEMGIRCMDIDAFCSHVNEE